METVTERPAASVLGTTTVVASGRRVAAARPSNRTESTVSRPPLRERNGSFGQRRKTTRSVAVSGAKLTDKLPVTSRKPLRTFTRSTYRGNGAGTAGSALSAAQTNLAAAGSDASPGEAPTATKT